MSVQLVPAIGRIPDWTMGDRIRKARRMRGVSQQELAEAITRAGYPATKQAVGNWESGANDVDPAGAEIVAAAVASLTGVPASWLLGRRGESPEPYTRTNFGYKSNRSPYLSPLRRINPGDYADQSSSDRAA